MNSVTLAALMLANEAGFKFPTPYEEAMRVEFCGECPMLSVTEKNQKRGEKHFCNKYNKQVYHMRLHPRIVRVPECDEPTAKDGL